MHSNKDRNKRIQQCVLNISCKVTILISTRYICPEGLYYIIWNLPDEDPAIDNTFVSKSRGIYWQNIHMVLRN